MAIIHFSPQLAPAAASRVKKYKGRAAIAGGVDDEFSLGCLFGRGNSMGRPHLPRRQTIDSRTTLLNERECVCSIYYIIMIIIVIIIPARP